MLLLAHFRGLGHGLVQPQPFQRTSCRGSAFLQGSVDVSFCAWFAMCGLCFVCLHCLMWLSSVLEEPLLRFSQRSRLKGFLVGIKDYTPGGKPKRPSDVQFHGLWNTANPSHLRAEVRGCLEESGTNKMVSFALVYKPLRLRTRWVKSQTI